MLTLISSGGVFCCVLLWSLLVAPQDASPETSGNPSGATEALLARIPTEDAIKMVEKLLEANSSTDLTPLIRPGTLSADEALQILVEISTEHGPALTPRWTGSLDTLTLPTESVIARYKDGHQRLVGLVPDDEGNWKIDFDSFAQLCLPSFEDLADGKSSEGLVRVVSNRDTYFNGKYADEDLWACFALRATSKDATLYGYCLNESDIMKAMLAIDAKSKMVLQAAGKESSDPTKSKAKLTLKIKKDPEAASHQFEITSVISDTWIIPPTPLDEMLKSQAGP